MAPSQESATQNALSDSDRNDGLDADDGAMLANEDGLYSLACFVGVCLYWMTLSCLKKSIKSRANHDLTMFYYVSCLVLRSGENVDRDARDARL